MLANNFIESIINEELEEEKVKEVYTRFPPEPNGYLHIGHAKSLCLNFGTSKKYNGKCNLRFDDTNPSKEETEYVDSIKEDIKWLGFKWDALFYASDYFDKIYGYAEKLINDGNAYVCDLNAEQIRLTRGTLTEAGKNSPYRNRSPKENLQLFRAMKEGKFADGEKVLRAKIDMTSPNINMRDPVIYRILHATHHRTGDKWCIYPMYDFTHPICDAIEGITHSICTLEFEDHRPLYDWVVNVCGFVNKPRQIEFARLNVTNTLMSKRYLKKLVDEKVVSSWSDPRMPTLSGLRNKGVPAEALKEFCDKIGVSKANSEVEISYLDHFIRENLNVNADRAMAVLKPLKVTITNYEDEEEIDFEINPNAPERGSRKVKFSNELYIEEEDFSLNPPPKYFRLKADGYVRLKNAYIIKCDKIIKDENGNAVELKCTYIPESRSGNDTSGIKVKGVIQWVNAKTCEDTLFKKYKYLLKDSEYPNQNFDERLNFDTIETFNGKAEPYLKQVENNTSFQLLRTGYYKKSTEDSKLVLSEIVSLKDSYKK
jgi:glutaminyl-tRNA synthetase